MPLLRPLLSAATARALPEPDGPMPEDEPVVRVAGPDPDRVLLVGSGPVTGAGVHRHAEALPGAVARGLAERSGHGAVVEALGRPRARLVDLPVLLQGARLERFDALVLVIGLFDASDGARARAWSRALHRRLDALQRDGARDAAVVLTAVPPFSSLTARRGAAVLLADHGVRRLNRAIARAAAERTATGHAVLPPPTPATPLGSAEWYGACAEPLVAALLPLLARQRRG